MGVARVTVALMVSVRGGAETPPTFDLHGSLQIVDRMAPPGRYRIFINDSQLENKVAAYAPRVLDLLKNYTTAVEVIEKREAKATAT